MKSIATINFKGGVGKTTITWLLAKYGAECKGKKVLVVDVDAQMSLTMAVQLQENGKFDEKFENWYEGKHKPKDKTIFYALDAFYYPQKGHFDFSIDYSFIYEITPNLHFVPSVVELYWLDDFFKDREKVKNFISALLGKIQYSKTFNYDYIFFDCPPNFNALSHSVLSCSSLLLIPVNPDVFAARGVELIIDGLTNRIQPWPNPKVAIFMNKAKLYRGNFTKETKYFWGLTREVCDKKRREAKIRIEVWDSSYIPERVDIKRAIPYAYFPLEFKDCFEDLWDNLEKTLRSE